MSVRVTPLARLAELLEAATPGPWRVDASDECLDLVAPDHKVGTHYWHFAGPMTMGVDAFPEVKARAVADAELIALARNHLAALLNAADALALLDGWAARMPDAGFTSADPRWAWWHDRPRVDDVLAPLREEPKKPCGFCKGGPVGDAASWLDGKPRPPAPCPRCGETHAPLREETR